MDAYAFENKNSRSFYNERLLHSPEYQCIYNTKTAIQPYIKAFKSKYLQIKSFLS